MSDISWLWFSMRDQATQNWILHYIDPQTGRLTQRSRYAEFVCPTCGKIDEDAAIRSGLDDIKLSSRLDIFASSDGVMCFSERARCLMEKEGIYGLEFFPLPRPNKRGHQIALPTHFCPVDRMQAGFEYEIKSDLPPTAIRKSNKYVGVPAPDNEDVFCPACHRPWDGSCVGPLRRSLTLPDDPLCIADVCMPHENGRGKVYWFLVSSIVRDLFKNERIIGPDYFMKPL